MSPDPTPLEMLLQEVRNLATVADKLATRVSRLELWKARMEGLGFAFRWVPSIVSAGFAAGVTALVTVLATAH